MLCRADAVSTPYNIGVLRSTMTKAGARSLVFATAASPLPASQQALKGVALSMKLQIAPRTAALSSTTRIHGVRGNGMAEETTPFYYLGQYDFRRFLCNLCKFCSPSVAKYDLATEIFLQKPAEPCMGVEKPFLPYAGIGRSPPRNSKPKMATRAIPSSQMAIASYF